MLALTTSLIRKYDLVYLDQFMVISQTAKNREDMISLCMEFWDTIEQTTIDYTEFLYLMHHYISGDLYTSPTHMGPIDADHIESIQTLKQLALHGVLTIDGQRGFAELEQRSYLQFIVPIQSLEKIALLLRELFERGINVFGSIDCHDDNGYYAESKIILFNSEDISICDFNADLDKYKLGKSQTRVTRNSTFCHLDSSCNNDPLEFNLNYPKGYILAATIFSQQWDNTQCDDILLEFIQRN